MWLRLLPRKEKLRKSFTRVQAIATCYNYVHQYEQDTTIKAFEQTGISLCSLGKDDHKLHVWSFRIS